MWRTGEGTDHEHTGTETLGGEVGQADLGRDLADALALVLRLAELGHKRVGRVGDDGADDASEVAGGEGDTELGGLGVGFLGSGEDIGVEEVYDVLEEEELGHRVGDLSRPQGDEGAEGEAGVGGGQAHLRESSAEGDGEGARRTRLDLDLGHLEGAEGDVGEELGGSRASEPDGTLVLARGLLAREVHVGVLEVLVETVLEHALERVADEGGAEALPETPGTFLGDDGTETGTKALVLGGVDLEG